MKDKEVVVIHHGAGDEGAPNPENNNNPKDAPPPPGYPGDALPDNQPGTHNNNPGEKTNGLPENTEGDTVANTDHAEVVMAPGALETVVEEEKEGKETLAKQQEEMRAKIEKQGQELEELRKMFREMTEKTSEAEKERDELKEKVEKVDRVQSQDDTDAKDETDAKGRIVIDHICTHATGLDIAGSLTYIPVTGEVVLYGKPLPEPKGAKNKLKGSRMSATPSTSTSTMRATTMDRKVKSVDERKEKEKVKGGGKERRKSTGSFFFKKKNKKELPASQLGFHFFQLDDRKKLESRTMDHLCEHDYYVRLLTIHIDGKDKLAVACPGCGDITLTGVRSQFSTPAFRDDEYKPFRMCHGPPGTIFAHSYCAPFSIIELDVAGESFLGPRHPDPLNSGKWWDCYGMCYAPEPVNAVVLAGGAEVGVVKAISVENNKVIWEVKAAVDGAHPDPHGLIYYERHHVILVCDEARILVLNPKDGTHIQTLDLSGCGKVINACVHEEQLIVHHYGQGKHRLSFYTIE